MRNRHVFRKSLMPCTESDKIKRALTWIRKALDITERTNMPEGILRNIKPTLDAFGWESAGAPAHEFISTVGPTMLTRLPTVPDGEYHYYLSCDISHNDPAGQPIHIAVENPLFFKTALTSTATIGANEFVAMPRPLLVGPGYRLTGLVASGAGIAAPLVFQIRGDFVKLAVGEYLPGSPYG